MRVGEASGIARMAPGDASRGGGVARWARRETPERNRSASSRVAAGGGVAREPADRATHGQRSKISQQRIMSGGCRGDARAHPAGRRLPRPSPRPAPPVRTGDHIRLSARWAAGSVGALATSFDHRGAPTPPPTASRSASRAHTLTARPIGSAPFAGAASGPEGEPTTNPTARRGPRSGRGRAGAVDPVLDPTSRCRSAQKVAHAPAHLGRPGPTTARPTPAGPAARRPAGTGA